MVLCVQHQQQIRLLIKAIVDSISRDLVKSNTQTIHNDIINYDECSCRVRATRSDGSNNDTVHYTQHSQTQLVDTFTRIMLLGNLVIGGSLVHVLTSASCVSNL